MRLTGNFEKKVQKKFGNFFFSIFSFLRAFVVPSCRKSGFRVFLSPRYGAYLGGSRLVVYIVETTFEGVNHVGEFHFSAKKKTKTLDCSRKTTTTDLERLSQNDA